MQNLKAVNQASWERREKDRDQRYKFKNRFKHAYDRLCLHEPQSWLDIGTGNGYLPSLVHKTLTTTTITGIDFVMDILYQAHDLNHRIAANIDHGYLPFHDHAFDYITCMDVLEHLLFPQHALAEIYRLLKPAGRCMFSVPNLQFIEYVLSFIKGKVPPPASDPRHMNVYTINHLKKELSHAGLMTQYIAGCDASPGWFAKISKKYLCKTILIEAIKA
jgi:ubiquinone/menaquinone biosynthesis C-methylase UbiE